MTGTPVEIEFVAMLRPEPWTSRGSSAPTAAESTRPPGRSNIEPGLPSVRLMRPLGLPAGRSQSARSEAPSAHCFALIRRRRRRKYMIEAAKRMPTKTTATTECKVQHE